jgi:hypothetical protein
MKTFGWIVPFAIPLLVVTGLTAQGPESTGTLRGCITDRAGQPLPGVSVDISADGVHRTVVSNRDGCFEFAEAVVRVRITGHQLGQDVGCGPYIRHTATIVTVWKRHSKITERTITLLQVPLSGDAVPYAVGQDLILFLRWTSTQDAFESVDGSVSAFGIENGRIRSAGFRSYAGMSADDFLAELRALSER